VVEPTSLCAISIFDYPLYWNVSSAATSLHGDGKHALGFSYFFEFGMGFDLDIRSMDLPLIKELRVQGAGIVGRNITGWRLGFSVDL
jgi:hypothetical protein